MFMGTLGINMKTRYDTKLSSSKLISFLQDEIDKYYDCSMYTKSYKYKLVLYARIDTLNKILQTITDKKG